MYYILSKVNDVNIDILYLIFVISSKRKITYINNFLRL